MRKFKFGGLSLSYITLGLVPFFFIVVYRRFISTSKMLVKNNLLNDVSRSVACLSISYIKRVGAYIFLAVTSSCLTSFTLTSLLFIADLVYNCLQVLN